MDAKVLMSRKLDSVLKTDIKFSPFFAMDVKESNNKFKWMKQEAEA